MVHLIVLQHGIWGNARSLAFVEQCLADHHVIEKLEPEGRVAAAAAAGGGNGKSVVVASCPRSQQTSTYAGVDVYGERLIEFVNQTVERLGGRVTRISFIGYSLGGLIARWAVGKLWTQGFFNNVEPVNFVTIASPHLGVWQAPSSSVTRMYNVLVPFIASSTGRQLMLKDKHAFRVPLLCNMADPELPFFQALAAFKNLVLMANIRNDRMVPYCTASISMSSPYHDVLQGGQPHGLRSPLLRPGPGAAVPVPVDPQYPHIVQPGTPEEAEGCGLSGKGKVPTAVSSSSSNSNKSSWQVSVRKGLRLLLAPVLLVLKIISMACKGKLPCALPQLKRRHRAHVKWLEQLSARTRSSSPGPQGPKAAQEWMAAHLNQLPWVKYDVDTRKSHGHAAIVNRHNKFAECGDVMRFLVERVMQF